MSKSANKSLIGAFVLGVLVLVVAAVVVLGSGRLFNSTFINVMYFDGSVKGLNVGAPVMFRGVKIGTVKRIELRYDGRDLSFLIPVYAEIDPSKMIYVGHQPGTQHTGELIKKGLRAKLELASMVTGQLTINLDLYGTDTPARLVGLDRRYDEIPTLPSDLEQLEKTVEKLPIQELFSKVLSISKGLDRLINAPETQLTAKSIHTSVQELKHIIDAANVQVAPILTNIHESTDAFKTVSKKVDAALSGEHGLPAQVEQTLVVARDALKQAEKTLKSADTVISEKASILDDAGTAIEEVTNAARSLRYLTEYLEKHPEGVIRGKRR
jgi:paraquat-inducible protein B